MGCQNADGQVSNLTISNNNNNNNSILLYTHSLFYTVYCSNMSDSILFTFYSLWEFPSKKWTTVECTAFERYRNLVHPLKFTSFGFVKQSLNWNNPHLGLLTISIKAKFTIVISCENIFFLFAICKTSKVKCKCCDLYFFHELNFYIHKYIWCGKHGQLYSERKIPTCSFRKVTYLKC